MARIGVFVCHCGHNIAGTVDVERVAEEAGKFPGVAHSAEYRFMCSSPGQDMVKDAIKEKRLDGVVVAACSPHMHEKTFQRACKEAGLNPYRFELANIREHCSWVHKDKDEATRKALGILRTAVEKVKRNTPLEPIRIPLNTRALVIGAGVAGIQAATDIGDGGREVILVEKGPSIGGRMSQLSETFPTLDCSQCILTPKMVEVARNENVRLYTYSEVEEVSGYVGNFKVKIRRKARSVSEALCNGCGTCWNKCPVKKVPSEFEAGMGVRTAIYVPFPQAVPNIPIIDRENCLFFTTGKCKVCERFCPRDAVDYSQEDEIVEEEVGAIVVATGHDFYPIKEYEEYGYGEIPDVISTEQLERLLSASGPTLGVVKRPSDGKVPKTVVFVSCIGSRDRSKNRDLCSKLCCMFMAKHAILYKHLVHDGEVHSFYIDLRAGGKNYDEFVRRAIEEEGARYYRGRVSRVYQKDDVVVVKGFDTLSQKSVEIDADMVVLAAGITAREGADSLAQMLGISYDRYGFYTEAHPKLKPIETNTAGVFLAGTCQGPRDIPDTVAQGSAVAGKVLSLFARKELEREPIVAMVNKDTCIGCFDCEQVCPVRAIEREEIKDRQGRVVRLVANVNTGLCIGCGVCNATCRSDSIELEGFNDEEVYAELDALSFVGAD
jgi:heterodisulfide reductase subunit A